MGRGGGRRGGVAIIWHRPTEPKLEVSKDVGERRNRKGRERREGGREMGRKVETGRDRKGEERG